MDTRVFNKRVDTLSLRQVINEIRSSSEKFAVVSLVGFSITDVAEIVKECSTMVVEWRISELGEMLCRHCGKVVVWSHDGNNLLTKGETLLAQYCWVDMQTGSKLHEL